MATVTGRYPSRPGPLHPENMTATTRIDGDGTVRVRIDDRFNLDFWLEVEDTKPEYLPPGDTAGLTGVQYAVAQLQVLRAMCDRAPIMLARVNRAIAALEAVNDAPR